MDNRRKKGISAWEGTAETPNTTIQTAVFDASFFYFCPTTTAGWFQHLKSLKTIKCIEYLNTSQVTNMSHMYFGCKDLTFLNLSHFDTSKVTYMSWMFRGCSSLTTIYSNSTWSCKMSDSMFAGCTSLRGAVPYDDSKTDTNMANPQTGYFMILF